MDIRMLRLVLPGVLLVALVVAVGTRIANPLGAYVAALCVYWLWLAGILMFFANRTQLAPLMRWGQTDRSVLVLLAVPVLICLGLGVTRWIEVGVPAWALLPVLLAALVNGSLEETFWRGAVLPRPDWRNAVLAWVAFVGWHLALMPAAHVMTWPDKGAFLAGAAIFGAVWTLARLRTGGLFAGIAGHVGVNIGAHMAGVAGALAG
jgi:membrane protease YdiL (CAAX protease family)